MNPEILKAFILVALSYEPMHGYRLLNHLNDLKVEGLYVQEPTTLYRLLRSLENDKILRATWDTTPHGKGPARKVYSLTKKGHKALEKAMQDLNRMRDQIDLVWHEYVG